ncbi:hypothetical protein F4781DRAFT_440244 [Annulohypoxylon bovei var. microspora]|nr:hypothetical protein F4781DRAFT_440244 [Annulohypoxylon bovei var. microspora]
MNHSLDSYIHPKLLTRALDDTTVYSHPTYGYTPELPFQPQQLPMESIDSSLEYQKTINYVNLCASQGSVADSGLGDGSDILPRYIPPPGSLHYQQSYPITEDQKDVFQKPREGDGENKHEDDMIFKQEDDASIAVHRSSRSSTKLTSDESGLDKRERNRKAANKCRKKQKLANDELKKKARIMDEQHNYLIVHKASLESEMIELKNELLLHGACGCEPISDYLMQAAKNFANGRAGETRNAG